MPHRNVPEVQIDHIHADAVCQGVGEHLRDTLSIEAQEIPQRLRALVERLPELDSAQAPSIVPDIEKLTD